MSLLVITISEKQFVQLRDNVETVICHGLNGLETDLIWRNIVIGYRVVHFCQAIAFLWAFQHNFDTQIRRFHDGPQLCLSLMGEAIAHAE